MSDDNAALSGLGAAIWFCSTLYLVGERTHHFTNGNWWAVVVVCLAWFLGLLITVSLADS